jgi:GT2 family glycosyltransferase
LFELTIVIPVAASTSTLDKCLEGLIRASDEQTHITVVFDGPPSALLLTAVKSRGISCRALDRQAGQAAALNEGIRAATTEWVMLVDADVVVREDTIFKIRAAIESSRADAVLGTYTEETPSANYITKLRNLWHVFIFGDNPRFLDTFWTGCSAIRRAAWLMSGEFNMSRDLAGNFDAAFGAALRAAGCRIWFSPDVAGTHLKCWTVRSWLVSDWFERALPLGRLLFSKRAQGSVVLSSASRRAAVIAGTAVPPLLLAALFRRSLYQGVIAALVLPSIVHIRFIWYVWRRQGFLLAATAFVFTAVRYVLLGVAFWWVLIRSVY